MSFGKWMLAGVVAVAPGLALAAGTQVRLASKQVVVTASFEGQDAEKLYELLEGRPESSSFGQAPGAAPSMKPTMVTFTRTLSNFGNPNHNPATSIVCNDRRRYHTQTGPGDRIAIQCEIDIEEGMNIFSPPASAQGYLVRRGDDGLAKTLYELLEGKVPEHDVKNPGTGLVHWTARTFTTADKRADFACTQGKLAPAADPNMYQCFTHVYGLKDAGH